MLNIIILLALILFSTYVSGNAYYWVGGSGSWSHINHWATSSGGTVLHMQPPTANSIVIFDQNSFSEAGSIVTIDLKNAVCKDLIFNSVSNMPELRGTDSTTLRIFGSLRLDQQMKFNYSQTIYFEAQYLGQVIDPAGHLFKCELVFRGNGGGWEFADNFSSLKPVSLLRGKLKMDKLNFECNRFISTTQEQRVIQADSSQFFTNTWKVNGLNLQMSASETCFYVADSLIHNQGQRLTFDCLHFEGPNGYLMNNQTSTHIKKAWFTNGSILGNFRLDSLFFSGDALLNGNDSINYMHVSGRTAVEGGNHMIGILTSLQGCELDGHYQIERLRSIGHGVIKGSSVIDSASFGSKAVIMGEHQVAHLIIAGDASISGSNQINSAWLHGNSYLQGSNVFETLNFSPGRTYTFGHKSPQTINNTLNASGTCSAPIRMLSDTMGVQASIVLNGVPFNGSFLALRDMHAVGSVPFIALNSVDLGNNHNWVIETASSRDLYWVNGSGSWSDPQQWATGSGGAGGYCPPTEIDNVFFDQSSFDFVYQTVTIDVYNAVCRDMNWLNVSSNSPLLVGADTCTLNIYGSLYLNDVMENHFQGIVSFEATETGKEMLSSGNQFNNHIQFNGKGGWTLQDDLNTNRNIFFRRGRLISSGHTIAAKAFISNDTTSRELVLGTSNVLLSGEDSEVWLLNGQNLDLDVGNTYIRAANPGSRLVTFNGGDNAFIYNEIELFGEASAVVNQSAHAVFKKLKFHAAEGSVYGDCRIDSLVFMGENSMVAGNDTIATLLCLAGGVKVKGGNHVIGEALFRGNAMVEGNNLIGKAIFEKNAILKGQNSLDTLLVYGRAKVHGQNSFGDASLFGEGHINGTNVFHNLLLTEANTYYFQHGHTQTVHNNLEVQGSCTAMVSLQSNQYNRQATIHKPGGGVNGNYLIIRDIRATGNTPFLASNSVNLGNNQGWNIVQRLNRDLFWVNGSGNWRNSLNWSNTSGGIGGQCIPTPNDNVFFDNNSFQTSTDTVVVDMSDASFRSMIWNNVMGHPVLSGADTTRLRVYGSLSLAPNLKNAFYGSIYFEGAQTGHTITTNGVVINDSVVFHGIGGGWELTDDFISNGSVDLRHGSLSLNGNELRCSIFNTDFTNPRLLDISNSKITVFADSTDAWRLNTKQLQFNSNSSIVVSEGTMGLVRTFGGGVIAYDRVLFTGEQSDLQNVNTRGRYGTIKFLHNGYVFGMSIIDSLLVNGAGGVYGADSINYVRFGGSVGNFTGSRMFINTIECQQNGHINGNHIIDSVNIRRNARITGRTVIQKVHVGRQARIEVSNTINRLVLAGDGMFYGQNMIHDLILSPGNLYEFEHGQTQTISGRLQLRGNNCFPITIRSFRDGQQASISVPSGKVVSSDFIEIKDINATGGAAFYAGQFSTDVSNNTGWVFNNAPGYNYGFQPDITICKGDELILETNSFNPLINSTFIWHDGSTSHTYQVSQDDDKAWVRVNYADACFHSDTIRITQVEAPMIDLGERAELCESDTLFPIQYADGLAFQWHDGSTDPFIVARYTGLYKLIVTDAFGCASIDQVEVIALPIPYVNLGDDLTIVEGESVVLDAGNQGASFLWSTGETSQSVYGFGDQTYWVVVDKDGCVASDTVSVTNYLPCHMFLPSAFSPNSDGLNDFFTVIGMGFKDFELTVYNRWGEVVHFGTSHTEPWNGSYNGKPATKGMYMFHLRGFCLDGQIVQKTGTIALVR